MLSSMFKVNRNAAFLNETITQFSRGDTPILNFSSFSLKIYDVVFFENKVINSQ